MGLSDGGSHKLSINILGYTPSDTRFTEVHPTHKLVADINQIPIYLH